MTLSLYIDNLELHLNQFFPVAVSPVFCRLAIPCQAVGVLAPLQSGIHLS